MNSGTRIPVIGYASSRVRGAAARRDLERQAAIIAREAAGRGLELIEVVREQEPTNGKALARPGLTYALERIVAAQASGLVVSELARLARSAADLGTVIDWLCRAEARLIAVDHSFDTHDVDGRLAANLLMEVSRWELNRLSERTRRGLAAARQQGRSVGRPAVGDDPELLERIARMRDNGMTLQAIANRLNEEGVPTVRGGAKWRHSSVQAAVGYKRRARRVPTMPTAARTAADNVA